jgi:gamma-glutamyltranspeptidase/glutathione hydrolase
VESRIPENVISKLREWGEEVKVREAYDKYFGGAQGIMFIRSQKLILGGADSRRDGWGAGY